MSEFYFIAPLVLIMQAYLLLSNAKIEYAFHFYGTAW